MKPTDPPYAESRNLVTKAGEYVLQKHSEFSDDEASSNSKSDKTFANLIDRLEKLEDEEMAGNAVPEFAQFAGLISEEYSKKPVETTEMNDDFDLGNLYLEETSEETKVSTVSSHSSAVVSEDFQDEKAKLETTCDE